MKKKNISLKIAFKKVCDSTSEIEYDVLPLQKPTVYIKCLLFPKVNYAGYFYIHICRSIYKS
jgi:hypothetical protein